MYVQCGYNSNLDEEASEGVFYLLTNFSFIFRAQGVGRDTKEIQRKITNKRWFM